jgi:hypothetical protein
MTTRVLRDSGALLSHSFYADEVATAADGTVAVEITRADGTVLASGNATLVAGPPPSYTFPLPAQDDLDDLDVRWSGTFSGLSQAQLDQVEIVGGFFFSGVEGRAADPAFADQATYPAAALRQCRHEVEETIESVIQAALGKRVAFVPRFRRAVLSGTGLDAVELPDYFVRTVRSVTITGETAFTVAELADLVAESGRLSSTLRTWTSGRRNVVVAYEHGLDGPPPQIRRAALLLLKAWLPAFKRAGDEVVLSNARSIRLEGVGLSFGEGSRDSSGITTGVDAADQLIHSWLASPALASVPI